MGHPLLELCNLHITVNSRHGDVFAVKGIDLVIDSSAIIGLVGESGSGKTLTCLSILNLLPANIRRSGGSICFQGQNLDSLSAQEWRSLRGGRIALIMQNPMSAFDPLCTIGDHFIETIQAHRTIKKKAAIAVATESMQKVGLDNAEELFDRYPFQLSGGMLQRVMIALALTQEPELIIADEPTTALDATAQVQILELLADIRNRFGTSVLLISHDLGVIGRLADTVAIMHNGLIVEQAPAAELFANPLHPCTQSLLKARRQMGLERRVRSEPND